MKKQKVNIKILIMDVDGTMTDGKIYIGEGGEIMKAFNVKDGYGIQRIADKGIVPVVMTGRESKIVKKRCSELKIVELYQGVSNKASLIKELSVVKSISLANIAFIGDDINDLESMKLCGLTGCPKDAAEQIKDTADFISSKQGGEGAVREFTDYILSVMEKWAGDE